MFSKVKYLSGSECEPMPVALRNVIRLLQLHMKKHTAKPYFCSRGQILQRVYFLGDNWSCACPLPYGARRRACNEFYVFLLRTKLAIIAVMTPEARMTTISAGASTMPGIPWKKNPFPKR